MEPDATLIGSDCRIELETESAVDMGDALVINPCNAELDTPLGFNKSLQKTVLEKFGRFPDDGFERLEHFINRLVEFLLIWISPADLIIHML
jgi:hypothetical protein